MDLGTAGGGLEPPKQPPAAPGPPTAPPQRISLSSPAKLLQCAYFWVELGQTQGIFWYFLAQNFLAGHNKKCNGRCTICGQRWVEPCKHPHPVVMNTPTPQNFQNMKKNCRNLHFSVARGTGGGWPNQKMAIFFVLYIFSAIRVGWGRLYARIWGAWWCYCDLWSNFIPGEKIWGILEHFLKKR